MISPKNRLITSLGLAAGAVAFAYRGIKDPDKFYTESELRKKRLANITAIGMVGTAIALSATVKNG